MLAYDDDLLISKHMKYISQSILYLFSMDAAISVTSSEPLDESTPYITITRPHVLTVKLSYSELDDIAKCR